MMTLMNVVRLMLVTNSGKGNKLKNMDSKLKMNQPADLDSAVSFLVENFFDDKDKKAIEELTESQFVGRTHHMIGRAIRNDWYLWWNKDHAFDMWPKEQPTIVKFFNDLNIHHADDMSGIILTSVYRRLQNQELKLDNQVQEYIEYWKNNLM